MAFFYKHKPKSFNYVPRYYDPEKEKRERKKAELGLDPNASFEERMRAKKRNDDLERRSKRTAMILIGALFLFFFYLLYPVITRWLHWLVG